MRRFWRNIRGAAAIEFAFVLPPLLMLTLGAIEFGLILFDYQRAGEATRRAVRDLVINPPLAALDTLRVDGTVTCTGTGASVSCSGGAVDGDASTTFAALYDKMEAVFEDIEPTNVSVTYAASGVDKASNPGVVTPVVTLSLTGMRHEFLILQIIPGVPTGIDFPAFAASRVSSTQAL
jgi:Flp pilus assembly protein TadG